MLALRLFEKAAELGYVPSLSEKCLLLQIAERNPITQEVQKLAEASVHKLATGTHYATDQFKVLPFAEVKEVLPDLAKTASLGMFVLHPIRGLFEVFEWFYVEVGHGYIFGNDESKTG